MIGVSLPLDWLCGAPHDLGSIPEVLDELKTRGVGSVELRAVLPNHAPADIARAADLLWDRGFSVTVHGTPRSRETAVRDVFAPLTDFFARNRQNRVTITVHPIVGDNVAMLRELSDHAVRNGYPVTFALENNRLLPDKTEGDSTALVLDIVEQVNLPNVGICFDMGHYMYYLKKNCPDHLDRLPPKAFFKHVVHTHIHALRDKKTHFPLDTHDLPLSHLLEAVHYVYFGVYNIELDFPRFSDTRQPRAALFGSVDTLKAAMPFCARLYDDIRKNFDDRLLHALTVFDDARQGTRFSLIHSSSYLFCTGGFRWAMDVSFRNAYTLASTPHRIAELFRGLDLMIISHGHDDHFEERTVRLLAQNNMQWIIPDFLLEQALAWGIPREHILVARPNEPIRVGTLTVTPFPGRHLRPITGKGAAEYGYHITADGAPSMAFPVDVRDFSLDGLPDLPPADYCFANVWLGDKNGTAADYSDRLETYARFMLRFSDRNILFSHLYENGRRYEDMWRTEHAELLAETIRAISPDTQTVIPKPGEIIDLGFT